MDSSIHLRKGQILNIGKFKHRNFFKFPKLNWIKFKNSKVNCQEVIGSRWQKQTLDNLKPLRLIQSLPKQMGKHRSDMRLGLSLGFALNICFNKIRLIYLCDGSGLWTTHLLVFLKKTVTNLSESDGFDPNLGSTESRKKEKLFYKKLF